MINDANAASAESFVVWEEALEGWEYLVSDVLVSAVQKFEGVTLTWPYLCEAYVAHEIRTEALLRIGRQGSTPADYVAVLESCADISLDDLVRAGGPNPRGVKREKAGDRLVFGPVIESLHESQPEKSIRSVVWLKRFDHLDGVVGNPLDHALSVISFPRIRVSANGEGSCGIIVGGRIRPSQRQLPSNHVESGAKVMNRVGNNHPHAHGRQTDDPSPRDIVDAIRIKFSDGVIRLRRVHHEHSRFMCQCVDVFVRSLKPQLDAQQFIGHDVYSDYERQQAQRADREDAEGPRDSYPEAGRILSEPQEDAPPTLNSRPTEEVAPRTKSGRRRGGYSAKHTHLGSPEDA